MTDTSTLLPPVAVRRLREADREEWRRLWTAYLAFYDTTVPEEVYRTTFARILAGNAGTPNEYRGLIAERDGRAIGIVHYLFHRHCWQVADVCYLQDLYVDEDVRGSGAGRALIEAVYAAADADGSPFVYWTTQHYNETARKLYDRIGTVSPFIKYMRY